MVILDHAQETLAISVRRDGKVVEGPPEEVREMTARILAE